MESGSFDQGVPEAECGHNGTIESLAGVDIGDAQVQMVEEPATVKLHGCLLAP